jgi:hypothetical protein
LSLFGGGLNVLHFEVITDRQSILSTSLRAAFMRTLSLLFEFYLKNYFYAIICVQNSCYFYATLLRFKPYAEKQRKSIDANNNKRVNVGEIDSQLISYHSE